MANEGLLVCIYDKKNPNLYQDTINNRFSPTYLDEVGGVGGGTFTVLMDDEQTHDNPSLLGYRQVVRLKHDDVFIGGWIIDHKKTVTIDEGGKSKQVFQVVGSGLLGWMSDAEVRPYGGLKKLSGDSRFFSFASEPGDWYVDANWDNVVELGTVHAMPQWGESPTSWPEGVGGAAKWLWSSTYTTTADTGVFYFRRAFTVATAGVHVFYLAADDSMAVYVDGQEIVTDNGKSSFGSTTKVEMQLETGTHYLGVRVTNGGGAAGFLASCYLKSATDGVESLVFNSSATGWKCLANPAEVPGWSVGEIILTLMAEAEARGVLFPTWLTPTFTSALDSNGDPWVGVYDWEFTIGESLLSVLNKITEVGYEAWVDPDTLELNMLPARGIDRSTGINAVVFEAGKNLRSAASEGVGKIKNSLSVKTAEGWLTTGTQDATSITEYGVVEGTLVANTSTAIAEALVPVVFARRAVAEEGASYNIFPSEDEQPFKKFYAGDWVKAPNDRNELVPRRAVSVSLEEGEAGNLLYTLEFDTIFQSDERKLNKILSKQPGAGLGGGFSNAVGIPTFGAPTIVTPGSPVVKYPKAPVLSPASAAGYWSADGLSALGEVTLNWTDVIENTDESPLVAYGYKVFAREVGVTGSQELGTVVDSDTVLRGLIAGSEWAFKVQTIGEAGQTGVFSNEVTITIPVPDPDLDEPTTPDISVDLTVVTIDWDGFLDESDPSEPPVSWLQTEVEQSDTEFGTYILAGVTHGGVWVGAGFPIGTRWFRLVARDRLGRLSAPSVAQSVTISSSILDTIEDAQQTADDALDAANAAQTTADGRNRIYWASEEPTPTPAQVQGDLWYSLDIDGRVTGVSQWNGTIWQDYRLVADSIIVPGSIGNVLIGDGAITAPKITASEEMWARVLGAHRVNADEVDVGSLTAAVIQAGTSDILTLTAAQAINLIVENLVPIQDDIDANTTTLAVIGQFFEFLVSGLRISASGSPFSVNLDNDSLDFMDGANIRAWLTAGGFFAERMTVTNDLTIGNMKLEYDSTLGLIIQPTGA